MTRSERQHPRYAHEAVITLHVAGNAHQGRTSNVSRGGLCADLAAAIPAGTELEVDLQLVFDDATHSEALRIPARVAWCTDVDDAHQIGLMFRPLAAELAEYLTMFLRYLDDRSTPTKQSKSELPIDDRFR